MFTGPAAITTEWLAVPAEAVTRILEPASCLCL